jgi:hypothetical protein
MSNLVKEAKNEFKPAFADSFHLRVRANGGVPIQTAPLP